MESKINRLKLIASLPANVRTNIAALRKLHMEMVRYDRRKTDLELDFFRLYEDSLSKRRHIITGSYVPRVDDLPVGYPGAVNHNASEQPGGVPDFWLTVFQLDAIRIQKDDEDALRKLVDVRVEDLKEPHTGFGLVFEFEPNEFFGDSELKKTYLTNGTEIYDAIGQKIHWKGDGDLTKRCEDSFFNFFSPKRFEDGEPERHERCLKEDFELGRHLEQWVIPRATAIFLGRDEDEEDELFDCLEDEAFCGVYSLDKEAEEILMSSELESFENLRVE